MNVARYGVSVLEKMKGIAFVSQPSQGFTTFAVVSPAPHIQKNKTVTLEKTMLLMYHTNGHITGKRTLNYMKKQKRWRHTSHKNKIIKNK